MGKKIIPILICRFLFITFSVPVLAANKVYTIDIEAIGNVEFDHGFNKGFLSPARQKSGSFEQVKEITFAGSDYKIQNHGDEVSTFAAMLITALSIAFPILFIIFIMKLKKRSAQKKRKRFSERFGYFREIPNEGNTNAAYALGRFFEVCEDGAILAAVMLRLIVSGCLSPVSQQEAGFMGKTKEVVNLQLTGSKHSRMMLYRNMKEAERRREKEKRSSGGGGFSSLGVSGGGTR